MPDEPVLSRHRLPRWYRWSLAALWLLPIVLLLLTLVFSRGLTPALLDPRLVGPMLLMGIPAFYVWQEGVDVLPSGLVTRVFLPRYHPYERLDTWYFDRRPHRRVLTIWDLEQRKVFEYRVGQLSDLPCLLDALKTHLRYRGWPY